MICSRTLLSIAAAAMTLLAASVATAAAPAPALSDEDAAAAYQDGRRLYDAGRFGEAATRFVAAYDHFRDTNILWNVGRSFEQAGDYPEARKRYRELLAKEDVSAQIRVDAGEALGRVGAKLAAREAATTPALRRALLEQELAEAKAADNGELVEKLGNEIAALPPIADGGTTDGGTTDGGTTNGGTTDGGTAFPDDPGPAPEGDSMLGWILGGSGIGLMAGGIALYLVGQGKHDEVDDALAGADAGVVRDLTRAEALALNDDGTTFKTIGYVGIGLGTAAVATGAVLLLLGGDSDDDQGSVHVAPHPLPGGFGVGLSATY